MGKLGVQGTEIKSGNILSFFSCIYNIQPLNKRLRIVDDPKSIVIFTKLAFSVKILNLVKDEFKGIRYQPANRLSATFS